MQWPGAGGHRNIEEVFVGKSRTPSSNVQLLSKGTKVRDRLECSGCRQSMGSGKPLALLAWTMTVNLNMALPARWCQAAKPELPAKTCVSWEDG